jgi:nitrate/TMAO reductase-like tetraheme cytochrome c subunit
MNQDLTPPLPDDSAKTASDHAPETNSTATLPSPAPRKNGKLAKLRRFALRAAAFLGVFVLFLVVLVAAAGWYTSRSQFCRSCHIMEPYYASWAASKHKDVSCIECHFAPGLGGKVRGKMLGLVQLAKYVTASAGPRPAAEVPDASCLRSGCHETRLLSGRVDFHNVNFDHTRHYRDEGETLTATGAVAEQVGEITHGIQLRCTSCHSQIVQGKHIAVTESTCFLCHFKNQPFNEGLSACTHCHQIPTKEYDLGGGVKFTHELAYQKGVDCVNCHLDVVRGKGEVPQERCLVCHNRENDLSKIKDFKFMHAKHVSEHKVDCLDCHLRIEHSLDKRKVEHMAGDCTNCHPDHHQEQVKMFEGVGEKSVTEHAGSMWAARVGCPTCHRVKEVSNTGSVLWKSSAEVCSMCHEATETERLQKYHEQLRAALPALEDGVGRARKALSSAELPSDRAEAIPKELDAVEHDLAFLRVGNDIHNIHFASKLELKLLDRIAAVCKELKIDEPKIELSPPVKEWK